MADASVNNPVQTIDPMFAIPNGATDLEYGEVSTSTSAKRAEVDEYTGLPIYDPYADLTGDNQPGMDPQAALETPEVKSIFSQTLRRGPGGINVVDVVIEVDDIPGADRYEIRIAKI